MGSSGHSTSNVRKRCSSLYRSATSFALLRDPTLDSEGFVVTLPPFAFLDRPERKSVLLKELLQPTLENRKTPETFLDRSCGGFDLGT